MRNPRLRRDPPTQFMSVPNTIWGRSILWALRRYMNKERYSLVLRGRSPKKGFKRTVASYDTPKQFAKRLGVYIKDHWEDRCEEYSRQEEFKKYEADRVVQLLQGGE